MALNEYATETYQFTPINLPNALGMVPALFFLALALGAHGVDNVLVASVLSIAAALVMWWVIAKRTSPRVATGSVLILAVAAVVVAVLFLAMIAPKKEEN